MTDAPPACACGDELANFLTGHTFCEHCDRPSPHEQNARCYRCVNLSKERPA